VEQRSEVIRIHRLESDAEDDRKQRDDRAGQTALSGKHLDLANQLQALPPIST
jgi:hypothetical protein